MEQLPTVVNKPRNRAIITNKDLILSYIVTSARYDFSVCEKRILYRIIELNQFLLEGKKIEKRITIETDLFKDRVYEMPISYFLNGEDDKNHKRIKQAFESLESKGFTYEDDKIITGVRLIQKWEIKKYESVVKFRVDALIYDALLNFSKGFRKLELRTAMQFESVYSMRFYELVSGQKSRLSFNIDTLKAMFNLEHKYRLTADLIRYVIKPAQAELNAKSPYTFTFQPYKVGRKIQGFHFFPVYQPQHRDNELEKKELQKQTSPYWDVSRDVILYLEQNFFFDKDEIKRNMEVFKTASAQMPDLILWLANKRRIALEKRNPKGYIINAIKRELKLL